MQKFIAILIGCSLTLAISVRAEQVDQADVKKKPVQKSKTVQKQQFTPKQHTVPNTHVQTLHNTVRQQRLPLQRHTRSSQQCEDPRQQRVKGKAPYAARRSIEQVACG